MSLIFDLETNGLLDQLDTIHCIGILDTESNEGAEVYHGKDIPKVLERLSKADEIIGHNILGFDIHAIKKVYPEWTYQGKATDTLVLSQLFHADLIAEDSAISLSYSTLT